MVVPWHANRGPRQFFVGCPELRVEILAGCPRADAREPGEVIDARRDKLDLGRLQVQDRGNSAAPFHVTRADSDRLHARRSQNCLDELVLRVREIHQERIRSQLFDALRDFENRRQLSHGVKQTPRSPVLPEDGLETVLARNGEVFRPVFVAITLDCHDHVVRADDSLIQPIGGIDSNAGSLELVDPLPREIHRGRKQRRGAVHQTQLKAIARHGIAEKDVVDDASREVPAPGPDHGDFHVILPQVVLLRRCVAAKRIDFLVLRMMLRRLAPSSYRESYRAEYGVRKQSKQ